MAGMTEGKIALVTGGGSGIGRAAARIFAREGAKVMVSDVNVSGGEETVALIQEAGGDAAFTACDVSREAAVEALVARTVERYGRVDCAFNNAGIRGELMRIAKLTVEDFDRLYSVNQKGVWLCMKHEIRQMMDQGGGAIVNNASTAGLVGVESLSGYAASKHAVVGMTRTVALEYATRDIRVNAVCPGAVMTPMLDGVIKEHPKIEQTLIDYEPMRRLGRPEEIGEVAVWLCSDRASFVTGQAVAVDGGLTAA
jgi:NAD(P)-dependent dehydrogenase (short-subunit alcohol dehydrogenase family)